MTIVENRLSDIEPDIMPARYSRKLSAAAYPRRDRAKMKLNGMSASCVELQQEISMIKQKTKSVQTEALYLRMRAELVRAKKEYRSAMVELVHERMVLRRSSEKKSRHIEKEIKVVKRRREEKGRYELSLVWRNADRCL